MTFDALLNWYVITTQCHRPDKDIIGHIMSLRHKDNGQTVNDYSLHQAQHKPGLYKAIVTLRKHLFWLVSSSEITFLAVLHHVRPKRLDLFPDKIIIREVEDR